MIKVMSVQIWRKMIIKYLNKTKKRSEKNGREVLVTKREKQTIRKGLPVLKSTTTNKIKIND